MLSSAFSGKYHLYSTLRDTEAEIACHVWGCLQERSVIEEHAEVTSRMFFRLVNRTEDSLGLPLMFLCCKLIQA